MNEHTERGNHNHKKQYAFGVKLNQMKRSNAFEKYRVVAATHTYIHDSYYLYRPVFS